MSRPHYSHRQIGWVLPVLGLVLVVGALFVPATTGDSSWAFAGVFSLALAIVYSAFATLRTSVDGGELVVAFTFGWPRRRISLDTIEGHSIVRNKWWYGLGVRAIPGGMLYAVWGLDAVEVNYHDGKRDRMLRIGTNDTAGLDKALSARRS